MKTWDKDEIRTFIGTATESSLANMVVALFHKQTEDEKQTNETNHNNRVGFTSGDAKRLTLIAKFCIKHQGNPNPFSTTIQKNGKPADWMIKRLRKSLPKYAGQLAKIRKEKAAFVAA